MDKLDAFPVTFDSLGGNGLNHYCTYCTKASENSLLLSSILFVNKTALMLFYMWERLWNRSCSR